jgi:tetratricopeptide (TPR) repeat protein
MPKKQNYRTFGVLPDNVRRSDDPWAIDEPIDSVIKRIQTLAESGAGISISCFKIVSVLLLLILIGKACCWFFSGGEGVTIQPFEILGLEGNQSGATIAQLLNYELQNIQEINEKAGAIKISIPIENSASSKPLDLAIQNKYCVGGLNLTNQNQYNDFDVLFLKKESIKTPLTNLGTIGNGGTSISLGNLFLFVKRDLLKVSPSIITGSLQKYNTTMILIATFENQTDGKTKSWEVIRTLAGKNRSINEQIPSMISELAYRIALYLGSTFGSKKKDLPQSWEAFEYLVQGKNAYIKYNITGSIDDLERARNNATLATKTEHNYQESTDFLSNLAFLLLKDDRSNEAKDIFRDIESFDPIKCNIGLGLAYIKEKDYSRAIMAYDTALLADCNNIFALNSRGITFAKLQDYAKAIQDYDAAIKINSSYALLWDNKGNALYGQGKYDEAIKAFDNATHLDQNDSYAWNGKGNALLAKGKYVEAIDAYNNVTRIDPMYVDAWTNKGLALEFLYVYPEATQAFNNSITLDQATQAFNNSITLDQNNSCAWNGRGYARGVLGDNDAALKDFEKAIELKRDYADAWNNKGIALFFKGNDLYDGKKFDEAIKAYEEAIKAYDEAIRLDPEFEAPLRNKDNASFAKAKALGYKD